jgi:rod shape-determining protein MreC
VAKPRRGRRTLTTLLVLVLISVSIITFDQRGDTHHLTSGLKSVAHSVFAPFQSVVNDILHPIGDAFAGAVNYGSLQTENRKLQATIGRLRQQAAEEPGDARTLQQLALLKNLPFLGSLNTVTAATTQISPSNFAAIITIDKGRDSGVLVGMAVVGAGGMIGQVVESFHHSASVRLLTDGQSTIGVSFGGAGCPSCTALVDGNGPGNPLSVDSVPPTATFHKGEILATNNLQGAVFPPNIPVARVSALRSVPDSTQKSVDVVPAANLDQLAYVEVVLWQPPA